MSVRKIILLLCVIVGLSMSGLSRAGTYSGGSGTEVSPYQIADANDWQELTTTTADWSAYFELIADVDLAGIASLTPVGTDANSFTGVFDGNGYVISNAVIDQGGDYDMNVGLFGYVYGGQIHDVGVENADMTGYSDVGALVGENNTGTIQYCWSSGTAEALGSIGGLVGKNTSGTISNCQSSTSIISRSGSAGGLAGQNYTASGSVTPAIMTNCSASGTVTANGGSYNTSAGGLVGSNQINNADIVESVISNCSATGSVTATSSKYARAGGLVGLNQACRITGCNASGAVTSSMSYNSSTYLDDGGYTGGLVGLSFKNSTITDCYATGSVTGTGGSPAGVGGLVGGTGTGSTDDAFNTITNCYATGDVTGGGGLYYVCVGGLVGRNCTANPTTMTGNNETAFIDKCYATGNIYGKGYVGEGKSGKVYVGGLVGRNYTGSAATHDGIISNCYARGSVTGESGDSTARTYVAGLVGTNETVSSTYDSIIENCYATGAVLIGSGNDGSISIYGLAGPGVQSATISSFWDTETSGTSSTYTGTGQTTAQMQTRSTFTDAGWDFVNETANGTDDIWRMAGYPVLDGLGEGSPGVSLIRSQGGTQQYFTIQAAINDANDLDLVVADPRTYNEQINFLGKAIIVRSTDANDWDVVALTIINANDLTEGTASVTFNSNENANSVLAGFTITGGDYGVAVKGNWPDLPSPVIQQCIIENTGSIGIRSEDASPIIQNNIIRDIPGKGIHVLYNNQLQIKNNLLHDNNDAIEICNNNEGEVANNTIVKNETGISTCIMSPEIKNCIFWDNSYFSLSPDFVATYSCLDDAFNSSDPNFIGSISDDPNFVDAANDDFHLLANSPCIDAGDPNGVYTGQIDIDGDSRVIGSNVDMGADEVNN